MKYLILFISLSFSFIANSQIDCNNGVPNESNFLTASFAPGSTSTVAQIQFTSVQSLSGITQGFPGIWLKVPGVLPAPIITNVTSSNGMQLSSSYVLNELGDGFHYYYIGNSGSPQNPSALFPTIGSSVNIASITFDIPVTPTIVLTELAPVQDLASEWFYYRTGFMTCNRNEDNLIVQSPNIVLPIHLSSFSATKHTERSSLLNWTTSLEINSDFFGIERSKDGNNWETIGRVTGAGNSSKKLAYEFIDDNLPLIRTKEQVFYYRLRMTDLDGQYKYSDVRGVNFGKLSTGVVTIYPNPTVEHINVDLSGMDLDAGKVDLFVYDMAGRQVIKKSIIGNGIELIDVSQLPANTYNVVVKQGETAYQQRVIKID